MARDVQNVGASVRARLLNLAKERGVDFQLLAIRYGLERLLYRLSVSPHRNRFVLKGAMLFPVWLDDILRPTRDVDFLGYGDDDVAAMEAVFRDICTMEVPDDGVSFDSDQVSASRIKEDTEYGGIRLQTEALLDSMKLPIRVDIGFGDAVTPRVESAEYPALLDAPAPILGSYPRETVVAEKFQATVALGAANSRMKDFYDLWMLSQRFDFDGALLTKAVEATFSRRRTALPSETPVGLSDDLAKSTAKQNQWHAFLNREPLADAPGQLITVTTGLREFLLPIVVGLQRGQPVGSWAAGGPWRRR
ncbi:nucleotidyl transferase AbiEii/AbiGii toxin family protein [Aquisalimonas lutea]|uniref:nucleotidyl transferase AbiEii/AbiGii toxin family protein n=1 Tax=Aquisalimonas lutea TaxID=1327750 RepID=UPI0025B5040F|nr:nucleotidyl transferase AbiEii/AbiGii toxin family protein [Aquisalimonas lutea]MDN3519027.1 nucleotidyl transferase AbiEii/AbiGii toxin family protein [Aquisalimonas lutea]